MVSLALGRANFYVLSAGWATRRVIVQESERVHCSGSRNKFSAVAPQPDQGAIYTLPSDQRSHRHGRRDGWGSRTFSLFPPEALKAPTADLSYRSCTCNLLHARQREIRLQPPTTVLYIFQSDAAKRRPFSTPSECRVYDNLLTL